MMCEGVIIMAGLSSNDDGVVCLLKSVTFICLTSSHSDRVEAGMELHEYIHECYEYSWHFCVHSEAV